MSYFDSTQMQIVIKLVLNRKLGKGEIKVTERWSVTYSCNVFLYFSHQSLTKDTCKIGLYLLGPHVSEVCTS